MAGGTDSRIYSATYSGVSIVSFFLMEELLEDPNASNPCPSRFRCSNSNSEATVLCADGRTIG